VAEREAERYPTAALAHADQELELTDTEAARLIALKIAACLSRASPRSLRVVPGFEHLPIDLDFSPDGEWIAAGMLRVRPRPARSARLMFETT
jgi:hypothetical protein